MSRSPQQDMSQDQVQLGDTDAELRALSADDLLPAHAQRYQLLQVLGSGAMGEVLIAQDSSLARKVAFKRMAPSVSKDPGLAARFLREMQVTAQLDHPNVVPVYADERSADGSTGYAMKLVRGRTLTALLDEETRGSRHRSGLKELTALAARLELFLRVCDAIAYAHAKGVLHRDLKPDNIMIGPYNEVYVMDWGICRVQGVTDASAANDEAVEPDDDDAGRTRIGAAIGTPAYMSPEQAMGKNDELDGRSDQFSLGLILFELVGLKRARQTGGIKATMVSAVAGAKLPLEHTNPDLSVPRELAAIVDKATAANREQRYESVDALAADVRRYLHGEAVTARKDTPLQSALRFIGHHKQATLLALLVELTAGAGLTILALVRGEQQTLREEKRSERIGELTDKVDEQAHLIDTHFERSRGLVRALASRASALLSHADGVHRALHYSEEFDAGGGPQDTRMSTVHGRAISVDFPSFHLSPGVTADQVREELSMLPTLAQTFRDNLRATLPDEGVNVSDEDFRALVADKGLPILRQFCSTASGVHEVYPGQGGFPQEYDGRLRPKYTLAVDTHGVLFGNPYVDHMAGGDLLPGAAAIYDEEGKFRGVCGLDLPFTDLRDRFLALKGQRGFLEAFLVDKDNKILIRTKGTAEGEAGLHSNAALDRESLPWPELSPLLSSGHSGTHELKGHKKMAAWSPISATGWRYLAIADLDKLFE
jgi:serine/threonine protein kinase